MYRQGKRYLRDARKNPSPTQLHNLRKRMKYFWYQVEILQPIFPGPMRAYASTLESIAENLGVYHDLQVMQDFLAGLEIIPDARVNEALQEACMARKSMLLNNIWPLAEIAYSEKPRAMVDRLASYWKVYAHSALTNTTQLYQPMKNENRTAWILHFQEINKLMEDQLEKWKSINEITETYDEFIKNLKKLKDLQPDLEKNLEPVQDEFKEKRENLIDKIFPIANILAVYGSDNNLKKVVRNMIISREELSRLKKAKLLDIAGRMLKTTEKYFPDPGQEDSELARYGLTAIMVDEFSTALTKYAYALQLNKDLLRNRGRSKKTSNRLLKANRELLRKDSTP